jgi:uncharacterized membrane protein
MAAESGASAVGTLAMSTGSMTPWWIEDAMMWWLPFQGLISVAILATLIVSVVVLARTHRSGRGHDVLDILDARYANGEIGREDYLRRKQDILGAA